MRETTPRPGGQPNRGSNAAHGVDYILDFTLGIVLGCIALAFFIWIAVLAARGRVLPLDVVGVDWARRYHTPQEIATALEITALGSLPVILLVLLLATAFFFIMRRRDRALLLWVATLSGAALNIILKAAIARPRPPVTTAVHAGNFAFPSGHAMSSMVVYATLAYLIVRGDPDLADSPVGPGVPCTAESSGVSDVPAPRHTSSALVTLSQPGAATRALTIIVAMIVIFLVGFSRVYLGVHYATDVIGGYLAGFVWADLWALLYEAHHARRRRGG